MSYIAYALVFMVPIVCGIVSYNMGYARGLTAGRTGYRQR